MDPLNIPYFHFRWVLKLLNSHKCHCSHPVHIHDSNHTHCLRHGSWPIFAPTEWENSFTARSGGPARPEDSFLSQFMQRRRETAHPVLTKGFLQLSLEAAVLPGQGLKPAHLPLSHPIHPAEPKSQRHCQKWHHKLKVVWRIYVSITYNWSNK